MWSEPWFTVQFVYWFSVLREEVCSRTPAAQLQLWIYASIEWQAVLNWAAHPLTLLMALISERILYLSVSLSYKRTHTHIHSLAAFNWSPWWSLLAAFHLSIFELFEHTWPWLSASGYTYMFMHTNTETDSVPPAGHMLHFSLAYYIQYI